MSSDFHFLVPESFHKKLVQIGTVVSEKIRVKVTPASSFEQIMMGLSPRCYISSFVRIGLPVLEKKIFEGFLPYMGVAAILVM